MDKKMTPVPELQVPDFSQGNNTIAELAKRFIQTAYPVYDSGKDDLQSDSEKEDLQSCFEQNSMSILQNMSFFKIASCTIEKTDEISVFFQKKMRKLLAAAYASGITVCFGFIGRKDELALVLGLDPYNKDNTSSLKGIIQGILPGLALDDNYRISTPVSPEWWGMMEAVPTETINHEKQKIDYSGLLRSLNGEEFNILIMARPASSEIIQGSITTLHDIQTECSAFLKQNISQQEGQSHTEGKTDSTSTTNTFGFSLNLFGMIAPAGIGGGMSLGGNYSHSKTKSISNSISDTVSKNKSIGYEIQNHFAKDLIDYCEDALDRFKLALVGGGWDTFISYSAKTRQSSEIIEGYLFSEIAKSDKMKPPARFQKWSSSAQGDSKSAPGFDTTNNELLIPKDFFEKEMPQMKPLQRRFSTLLNSDELGMLFSFPESSVPGFELREGKFYALSVEHDGKNECVIGKICEGERVISNSPFAFSHDDINKHIFVCGITGCGKTNSVKKILQELSKENDGGPVPFLVLECAKKEYRNLKIDGKDLTIFTPGQPEIHSPQLNPFYIQPGISLQTHIDYLKDLFNASFSFYGPMTYILETCLHRIYRRKGWDLTMGVHPFLINSESKIERYASTVIKEKYAIPEHKFLFPTMQDLLNEVRIYIDTELKYDKDVSGNIKSAMIARLEGLCIGAKGFMFNTLESEKMEDILNGNVIFELEGLSDDADKAFVVGLLIVFINEFRQSQDENDKKRELKHVLVIEEAHRLLKNVSTERSSEFAGNPKGKAVEHFTNMLAEMRSYGQGVIIAEQIPSKIAPEVIKNSSNKIVHRLVSRDDQEFLANTIGVKSEEALYFGTMKPGFALCHKEGMYTPVSVSVSKVEDTSLSDQNIRQEGIDQKSLKILCHQIRNDSAMSNVDPFVFKFLNSAFWLSTVCHDEGSYKKFDASIEELKNATRDLIDKFIREYRKRLIGTEDEIRNAISCILAEKAAAKLCFFYGIKMLPADIFMPLTLFFCEPNGKAQSEEQNKKENGIPHIVNVIEKIKKFDKYGNLIYEVIPQFETRAFFERNKDEFIERRKLAEAYFLVWDDDCISEISRRICKNYAKEI